MANNDYSSTTSPFQYMPIPEEPYAPLSSEATFLDEVVASWELSWAGQLYLDAVSDDTFLEKPVDPTFNAIEEIKGTEYERYLDSFSEIRNREHYQAVKDHIDYNNYRREVRHEGGILPEFVSILGDPLAYVPIPFVKGLTFGHRFLKSGAMTGLLIGSVEPIRHNYDPTATWSETMGYVGGSFVMGGLIGGALGRRTFAPRSAVNESEGIENVFKSLHDAENPTFVSDLYDVNTPLFWRKAMAEVTDGYKLRVWDSANEVDNLGQRVFVRVRKEGDNDIIYTDDAQIERFFTSKQYLKPATDGVAGLPHMRTPDDLKKFLFEKETTRYIGGAPRAASRIEAENLLNHQTLETMAASRIKAETAGLDTPGIAGHWTAKSAQFLDRLTNDLGELVNNKMKTSEMAHQVADDAIALMGDNGVHYTAARQGKAIPHSANTKALLEYFSKYKNFKETVRHAWKKERLGIAEMEKTFAGYDPKALGLKVADMKKKASKKLGLRSETPMSEQEYHEKLARAMEEPEFLAKQSEPLKEAQKAVRALYDNQGKQLEELNMLYNRKSLESMMDKWGGRLDQISGIIATLPSKSRKLAAELERLKRHAESEVFKYKKQIDDLEHIEGVDHNPLRPDYLNHIYDQSKISNDLLANDPLWVAPKTIPNPLEVKGGMYKGMVVEFSENNKTMFGIINEIEGNGNIKVLSDGKKVALRKKDYTVRSLTIDGPIDKRFYSIPSNPNSIRGRLFKYYKENPETYTYVNQFGKKARVVGPRDIYSINRRADQTIDDITFDARHLDMEGDLGVDVVNPVTKDSKTIFYGANALMRRRVNLPNEVLREWRVQDMEYLARTYFERTEKRIQITKRFGDAQMHTHLWDMELNLLLKEGTSKEALHRTKTTIQTFRNNRDKIYGVFNTADPNSFFKTQLPITLRNWGSLAYMGKVTPSSFGDVGRTVMTHGLGRTLQALNRRNPFSGHSDELAKAMDANSKLFGEAFDVTMNDVAIGRVVAQEGRMGQGDSRFSRMFMKIMGNPMAKLQAPLYHANFLSSWTYMLKKFTGNIASSRFLEDALKAANGKATKAELERLRSYGFKDSEIIALGRMPIKKATTGKKGFYYIEPADMLRQKGGRLLQRKLQYAIFDDQNRTIITPSIADKPNMMYGVIRVKSEAMNNFYTKNPIGIRVGNILQYERQQYGGKLQTGYYGLPLQFFTWSFGAHRKLLVSGLSGREANMMGGILAMIGFAAMGDYVKNPRYWNYKSEEEKIYRAIEMSGVLTLPGDINFMLETISEGMFDERLGIRPMIGTPGRFGDANMYDAVTEFTGVSSGMFGELAYVYSEDRPFDEKASAWRRLIPFNNLLYLESLFKKAYDGLVNTIVR